MVQALPAAFSLGPAPGFGGMIATSVHSRTISLTPLGGGVTEAFFGFSGNAAGGDCPEGCSYSVQGTASSSGGRLSPRVSL